MSTETRLFSYKIFERKECLDAIRQNKKYS
nr:MAG TPA: hypothetical protein [Caudoviricetes sp.]DAP54400.1 MAG TPA: hypothetical protein [Caudoviricetes sp.]DAU76857.1 MAG TPA: hypothetical protein [Caudoviricetes sp.]